MTTSARSLEALLDDINGGRAAVALPELDRLLSGLPGHPGLLTLRAEALRLTGQYSAAVEAFRHAGETGASPRSWLVAGVLLTNERNIDEAVMCLHRAIAETPDSEDVLDALVTTLFNSNRHREGIDFARRQLCISSNPTMLARAALLLQANDLYEESAAAFKRITELAPDDAAIAGSALVPTRFTCEWEWIEELQRRVAACYGRGDFASPQEYPLTNLTWCADEACNLGVTRAYAARMVTFVTAGVERPTRPPAPRIRIGYLSCDFRNHATMHLMAGLLETHDRRHFEVFAYDYSSDDISEYRQRFLNAVDQHVPIHSLTDEQAAQRIAQDGIDILFDLKLYTGGGRASILAYRPAGVQVAYLGFPGSAATSHVDYIISDRFVTADGSAPYYTEKFCRLPHSYQCNDRRRFTAATPGSRADYGLPENTVVFGAFNQSYKIDRESFSVWLRVLAEVPDSVLWLLGQSPAAVGHLTQYATQHGLDPARLIFAPFAAPADHLRRLPQADAVLDALVCNGHTTTSDALWAGVPVITARGRHFASRVSESLLNAIGLPELVGCDQDDMVRIAKHIGMDTEYRTGLRARVAAQRLTAPLFDTARFTRDFESAIRLMVQRHRRGEAPVHLDVPDQGPLETADPPAFIGRVDALQTAYAGCPLCNGPGTTLGFAHCTSHPLWHEPLPTSVEWKRCSSCSHVHRRAFWTAMGLAEMDRRSATAVASTSHEDMAARRSHWTGLVEKAVDLMGGFRAVRSRSRPVWVDVGAGDGSLVMTALDYGFSAVGLDTNPALVARIKLLGFNAMQNDFMSLRFELKPDVLSMTDFLSLVTYPREALRKAADVLPAGGQLIVSTPDLCSIGWKLAEAAHDNPYWSQFERFHMFDRERLISLLGETGFEVVHFSAGGPKVAQIELHAFRKAQP